MYLQTHCVCSGPLEPKNTKLSFNQLSQQPPQRLPVQYSRGDGVLMLLGPAPGWLIGSAVMSSPLLSPPLANAYKALSVPSLYCIQIPCLCAPLRLDPNGLVAAISLSAWTGTGQPCSHTRSSSPNASWTGGYSGGDAERCYLQGQAEARQPLPGPRHQNSIADVKHGEPQISVHVVDAGIFRAGTRAIEDCHVVLQPVSHWRLRRKGRNATLRRSSPPWSSSRGSEGAS